MTRIPFEAMHAVVRDAFVNAGMSEHDASGCARVHTESSCDGVCSHGLNRGARFVDYVRRGGIDLGGRPTPAEDAREVRYPGEAQLRTRVDHRANGIVVDDGVWAGVLALAGRTAWCSASQISAP